MKNSLPKLFMNTSSQISVNISLFLPSKSVPMNKTLLIDKTIQNIRKLPVNKVKEVNDFAEFLLYRLEDQILTEGIQELASSSKTYDFLLEEPDLYTVNDLKVKFR